MAKLPTKRRQQANELYALLCSGIDEEEAQAQLELSDTVYARTKRDMQDIQLEQIRQTTTEELFLEYKMQQMACVQDLTDMLARFGAEKNSNAMVGAVRARSDIFDKIIKLGQEFGLLEKKPEEKRIIAGVVVANMSDVQLKQAIASELSGLNNLVSTYGEGPLNVMEMDRGSLHYSLPEEAPKPSKTVRAKANRVYRGRRVVKEPSMQ